MQTAYKQLQELLEETTICSQLQKGNSHNLTGRSYPFAEYSQVYLSVTEQCVSHPLQHNGVFLIHLRSCPHTQELHKLANFPRTVGSSRKITSTTSYQCIPLTREGKEHILEEQKQPQKILILSPSLSFLCPFSSLLLSTLLCNNKLKNEF